MKELTSVVTLQFTFITKAHDETEEKLLDKFLDVSKERHEEWAKRLGERVGADDVQLLDSKLFVLDKGD